MKKAKIWFASGLVLLLFGIGYGANVLRHTLDEGKVNTYKAQPAFSEQVIDYGAFGKDVYELQGRLSYLGFYHGKLDSYFGPKTRDALKWFQSEFGMEADGLAGPKTKLKLYNATKNWKPGMEYANAGGAAKPQTGTGNKTGGEGGGAGKVKAESADLSASNAMGLSENDLRIMANAVYGESRGEPFEGQVAVAAVILNRVKSPSFPNTVSGVIFQPGAFTAVADGQIWLEPNEQARKAVQQALNGWDPSGGCIYYFNPRTATSKWIWSRPQVKTIGEHIFCM
ncbi:Spore cortex-lytic enzyme precursor [compost metagenome]|uniref:Spore cortex-lytic enzyme n=1 Tax=Paenibacillus rhizolycopersici TaxID=2780073 RepID=A0ABS2HBE3_9BACL|nr:MULTISPECIES: spore cortex-lytic enzyme [Paenibacillus]MBM6997131.1 spore cortex-lytic enzyme [Paenibacillus rhizolycopersici]MUG88329.1 spore cortex-lytic enzyme [Paenibacillus timonensis]GIP46602.1 spore cortex-lytic enzyme [Paenibacillus sp. J53TS2]